MRTSIQSEILACATGTTDCIDFPETKTNLINIPFELYKNNFANSELHTNPFTTQYILSNHTQGRRTRAKK